MRQTILPDVFVGDLLRPTARDLRRLRNVVVDLHRRNLLDLAEWRARLVVIDQIGAGVRLGKGGENLRGYRVDAAGRDDVSGEGLADKVARLRVGRRRGRIVNR